ncbi:hypothetical protein [Roseobacter litoralis]|uniref:hypothetical protein n=1 Tax=Roseobacter litoralis TaxID=42443 RepID=UPI002494BB03|nr:hypothetical protein [Roseobacter litoralis]
MLNTPKKALLSLFRKRTLANTYARRTNARLEGPSQMTPVAHDRRVTGVEKLWGVELNSVYPVGFVAGGFVLKFVSGLKRCLGGASASGPESETAEKRRFGLSQMGAALPNEHLQSGLKGAGWEGGVAVTVLADGDHALPR